MFGIVLLTLTVTQGVTTPIAHRETLKKFLSENPSYVQMTEFDPATLKAMRDEWGFGKNFTPYYATGDFNADGRNDFATILALDKGKGALEPHVLIFNGTRQGRFQLAYNGREEPSPWLFIATMRNGPKRLYVGIAESDSAGCFEPNRRGYVVKPCGSN